MRCRDEASALRFYICNNCLADCTRCIALAVSVMPELCTAFLRNWKRWAVALCFNLISLLLFSSRRRKEHIAQQQVFHARKERKSCIASTPQNKDPTHELSTSPKRLSTPFPDKDTARKMLYFSSVYKEASPDEGLLSFWAQQRKFCPSSWKYF